MESKEANRDGDGACVIVWLTEKSRSKFKKLDKKWKPDETIKKTPNTATRKTKREGQEREGAPF